MRQTGVTSSGHNEADSFLHRKATHFGRREADFLGRRAEAPFRTATPRYPCYFSYSDLAWAVRFALPHVILTIRVLTWDNFLSLWRLYPMFFLIIAK